MRYIETQTFEIFWMLFPLLCVLLAASLFVSTIKYIADGDGENSIWYYLFKYNFSQGLFNFFGILIVLCVLAIRFLHILQTFLQ